MTYHPTPGADLPVPHYYLSRAGRSKAAHKRDARRTALYLALVLVALLGLGQWLAPPPPDAEAATETRVARRGEQLAKVFYTDNE